MKKTKKKTEETMPEEKSPITDAAGGTEAPQEGDPADGGYPDEMVMEKLDPSRRRLGPAQRHGASRR